MYIVAKIHNNSLGRVISATNQDKAKDICRAWAEEQFGPLNDEQIDMLENKMEIYDDSDSDNIYSFSIGIVE